MEVISTVRNRYPDIHITAAVSNISFNLPVRKMINLGFTVLALNAGLDSAILDPTNRDMMGVIYATEALLGEDDYCMEYIGAYREGISGRRNDVKGGGHPPEIIKQRTAYMRLAVKEFQPKKRR